MELPADKEEDKEMVGIPESFEVSTTPFFHREEDHDAQGQSHDPTSNAGPSCKVGTEEDDNLSACGGILVRRCEPGKVDHMRDDVHNCADYDRPRRRFMEGDVLIERNDVVQGGAAQQRDKVPAHREEDKNDIDVKDQGSCAGNSW